MFNTVPEHFMCRRTDRALTAAAAAAAAKLTAHATFVVF